MEAIISLYSVMFCSAVVLTFCLRPSKALLWVVLKALALDFSIFLGAFCLFWLAALKTVEYGLSLAIRILFLSGFFLLTLLLLVFSCLLFRTLWTSLELMIWVMSGFLSRLALSLYPALSLDPEAAVPHRSFRALTAPSVQMQNLPR